VENWKIKTNNKKTRQIFEKKWEYKQTVYQLLIDFKKACDSVSGEILYNIVIEFGILTKLVRLIKFCLTETCSRLWVGRNLSDMFHTKMVWKKEMNYRHCFQTMPYSIPL
jgi:hypothetical protein